MKKYMPFLAAAVLLVSVAWPNWDNLEKFATSLVGYKETTKPTAVAGQVQLYAKDKAGTSALYMQQDDGTETEIGPMPTTGTSLTLSGDITAVAFRGDGSALTGISAGGDITTTAWDGSNWTATDTAPSQSAVQGALVSALGIWQYQVSPNTNGGTATAGSWYQRPLNTEVIDTIGGSLSSNSVTLPAGTYKIHGWCVAYDCNSHKSKLYDVTNSIDLSIGSNAYNFATAYCEVPTFVDGVWHLHESSDIGLYHRVQDTKADTGQGAGSNFGVVEVYAGLNVEKIRCTTAVLTTAVNPSGTVLPAAGTHNTPMGVPFVVKATAAGGKQFSEWTVTGGASVTSASTNPTTAKITAAGTITAVFIDE